MMKGYKKCIDNIRKSGNGKKPLCKYFQQLDEINGEKPNIHPQSVLSSSGLGNISQGVTRKNETFPSSSTATSANVSQPPVNENKDEPEKKKRRYESTVTKSTNSILMWLESYEKKVEEREAARLQQEERQHQEKMEIFKLMIEKL